jgi:hypothetical protein
MGQGWTASHQASDGRLYVLVPGGLQDNAPEEPADLRKEFLVTMPGLPPSAYPKRIGELACEFAEIGKGMEVPLGVTAGQAIPLTFVVAVVKWGFLPCFAFFTLSASECTPHGYAFYPWWVWAAILPAWLGTLFLEYLCHRYVCVPKYQVLRCFKILGVVVPYRIWFLMCILLSALHACDAASDSAFLGTFLKAEDCWEAAERARMWNLVLNASIYRSIASNLTDLRTMVILSWSTSFFQLIWIFAEALPMCRDLHGRTGIQVTFDPGENGIETNSRGIVTKVTSNSQAAKRGVQRGWRIENVDAMNLCKQGDTEYTVIFAQGGVNYEIATTDPYSGYGTEYHVLATYGSPNKQNHGSAVMALAEGNGMHMVAAEDLAYASTKAELAWLKRDVNTYPVYIKHLVDQIKRGLVRTLLVGVLTNGWQLNLQVTLYAIRKSLHKEGGLSTTVTWQTLLSLAFSGFAIQTRMVDAFMRVKTIQSWRWKIRAAINDLTDLDDRKRATKEYHFLLFITVLLALMGTMCAFMSFYALLKLWFAHRCIDSVWNMHGCVFLEELDMQELHEFDVDI